MNKTPEQLIEDHKNWMTKREVVVYLTTATGASSIGPREAEDAEALAFAENFDPATDLPDYAVGRATGIKVVAEYFHGERYDDWRVDHGEIELFARTF